MNTFKPLPQHQAERLGQLVHATLAGIGDDVLLSADAPTPPSWAQLAKLRATASKAPDTALSAPAPQSTVRVVNSATETQRRAAEITAHETVRTFEKQYGKGATLADAREQDLADEYLDRLGLRP